MKGFLSGMAITLAVVAAGAWVVWRFTPEHLPREWREKNIHSPDYAPPLYRWKDEKGRIQLSDTPPANRPYETIRFDPKQNIVPTTLPIGSQTR